MGVELLTERYQDRVAGALSCYDRIIIPGHGARMVLRRGNGQVPAYTAYPDLRLPQVAQPLRDSPRENMERMAAENSLDIEIVRSRKSFRKEDRGNAILNQRGEQPGVVRILPSMDPRAAGRGFVPGNTAALRQQRYYGKSEMRGAEEKAMLDEMNRRNFLEMSVAAGAAFMAPRWVAAQSAPAAQQAAKPQDDAASTPVKPTKLYDNLYLLQGVGGNMALQTGADGNLLIDSSYAPAVPRIREAIAALAPESASAPGILVNTHWHGDHTGGNEGMHAAGFTIFAHRLARARLSTPQTMKLFHRTVPASPAGALPQIALDDSLSIWRNGDTLDLVHFDPAHTDGDIYIYFHKADVLHVGDIWFNGMYPFIDEGAGGSIGGMIRAGEKALAVAGSSTRIIPGHGSLGTKADLQSFRDLLTAVRDKVAALKAGGASEEEAVAKKPTAEFDAAWGKGFMSGDVFAGIVYRTL